MSFPGKMAAQVIGGGLFHKPATLLYPAEKPVMPKGFRGRSTFYAERCVFCKLCMKDCPSEAIQINKIGEKQYEAILHMGRCIYCGQCVQSCNKDALEMTTNYELAVGESAASREHRQGRRGRSREGLRGRRGPRSRYEVRATARYEVRATRSGGEARRESGE